MNDKERKKLSEQDLSSGKLVDQKPLETVEDVPSRLAGNNQIPDSGGDTKGTLHESDGESSGEKSANE